MRRSAAILVLFAAANCGNRSDGLVIVTLTSTGPLTGVARVHTHATAAGKNADFDLSPGGGGSVGTPITYGIDIPHTISGAIGVHADLFDSAGKPVASGSGGGTIVPGKRTDVAIHVVGGVAAAPPDMAQATPGTVIGDMAQAVAPPDLAMPPMLTIDTNLQPFGNITQGHTSVTAQFTITNTGTVAAGMPMLSSSGDTADFTLATDCNGMLRPMARCHVTAAFTPQASSTGMKDAKFLLAASPGGTVAGEVTGTALAPGKLSIMPDKGDCGQTLIGTTSLTKAQFMVKNTGNTSTGGLSISVNDPSAQFTASGCNGALVGGGTCMVTVTFTAKKRFSSVASFQINDAADATDVAPASVQGVGQQAATIAISPSSYTFPNPAPRNGSGATQMFTISNTGDLDSASLTAVTSNSSFTKAGDTCSGKPLTPVTPCTVQVQLTPQTAGDNPGQLQIEDPSATVLQAANLDGTGTPSWTREYSSSSVGSFSSVWAAKDRRHAWAYGANNTILNRQENGTWSADTISGTVASPSTPPQLTGSGPTDLWAISGATYLRSSGDGNWTVSNDNSVAAYNGIIAFDVNNIFVSVGLTGGGSDVDHVTGSGTVWNSDAKSSSCVSLYGSSPTSLFCSTYIQSCNGIDCSTYGTVGLRTASGWGVTAGSKTFYPYAGAGWASSATNAYTVPGGGQRPWHYDGNGFASVDSSVATDVYAVWGVDASHVYFLSSGGLAIGNGSSWSAPSDPLGKKLSAGTMSGVDANDMYIAGTDGDGGCIYHYH